MKRKDFFKTFAGAFIGILLYELVFDIADPFQNYWANYFTEIALIMICIFGGIFLVGIFMNKFALFQTKEDG